MTRAHKFRVVVSTNSRDRGSTSRALEAWTRLLPAEGIDPTVTVGGRGPLLSSLRRAGVPTRVRPLRGVPGIWPVPFALAVGRLAGTVMAARAKVLHVNEHDHHLVGAYAAKVARVPIFTHVRFRPTAEYARWLFRSDRKPDRLFFTSHTQMADSADAVRPTVPDNRWRVIPNGLDFSVFGSDLAQRQRLRSGWQLDDDAVALGMACAISPRKRVDHFIRLVARLRGLGVNAHGFIAGVPHLPSDAPLASALTQLAVSLGVHRHMRFLGYLEPAEPLFYAWDLCISTSRYETFGMTVLEAMGCGCPVVTYPGGSIAEVVADAASVVPDGNEDALLDECLRLIRDETARRALGACGRRRAMSTYDIRHILPRLAEEYRGFDPR